MTIAYEVESGGARLDCLVWTPERKNARGESVIFSHGWGGGAQYDDLLARLADEGYLKATDIEHAGLGGLNAFHQQRRSGANPHDGRHTPRHRGRPS